MTTEYIVLGVLLVVAKGSCRPGSVTGRGRALRAEQAELAERRVKRSPLEERDAAAKRLNVAARKLGFVDGDLGRGGRSSRDCAHRARGFGRLMVGRCPTLSGSVEDGRDV